MRARGNGVEQLEKLLQSLNRPRPCPSCLPHPLATLFLIASFSPPILTCLLDRSVLSCLVFRWVQEAEWELTSPPVINADAFVAEVGPKDMSFAKVMPRKK